MATNLIFQVRGDTAEHWEERNSLLKNREIGYDQTNRRLKVGDGQREWNDLPFLPPDVIDDLETGGSGNALSAKQGVELKKLVDTNTTKLTELETRITDVASKGVTIRDDLAHAESDTALSAQQGKVLNETKADKSALSSLETTLTNQINQRATTTQLNTLQTTLTNLINKKADKTELTTLQTTLTTKINNSKVTIANNLTTNKADQALSAAQGVALNDAKLAKADVTTESWTFTLESGSTVTKKVMLSK